MIYENFIKDGCITVFANVDLFNKDSIFKCLYWFTNNFRCNVSFKDESNYQITLVPVEGFDFNDNTLQKTLEKLERDLIDFNLRDIVSKETKNIRELLVAKAFSNGEFDELPPGEISDPVGFNPL